MLYFITGKKPNQQEITWHVGGGLPRITSVEEIYADGHELEYLLKLGFGDRRDHLGSLRLTGDGAVQCLRVMRADKEKTHRPTEVEMIGEAHLPEWHHNKLIKFWDLSLPEQQVYAAAYGAKFSSSHNKDDYCLPIARNALYSFWRRHGNPRNKFPADKAFRFADDDWGY